MEPQAHVQNGTGVLAARATLPSLIAELPRLHLLYTQHCSTATLFIPDGLEISVLRSIYCLWINHWIP